jgi:hypothetical protein
LCFIEGTHDNSRQVTGVLHLGRMTTKIIEAKMPQTMTTGLCQDCVLQVTHLETTHIDSFGAADGIQSPIGVPIRLCMSDVVNGWAAEAKLPRIVDVMSQRRHFKAKTLLSWLARFRMTPVSSRGGMIAIGDGIRIGKVFMRSWDVNTLRTDLNLEVI